MQLVKTIFSDRFFHFPEFQFQKNPPQNTVRTEREQETRDRSVEKSISNLYVEAVTKFHNISYKRSNNAWTFARNCLVVGEKNMKFVNGE